MRLPFFHVDAFSEKVFSGNPAAVMPLGAWLPEATMQALAAENNLSETAFMVPEAGQWAIRWFTPAVEIDLCGHATLAAAHVVFERLAPERREVTFHSGAGPLRVERNEGGRLTMTFPRRAPSRVEPPPALREALRGAALVECGKSRDLMAVLRTEEEVRALQPDLGAVTRLDAVGLIVTAPGAPGSDTDFVSRCFYPREGIDEDPVTGAAHCTLTPYWAARLKRRVLRARQVSRRGGVIDCQDRPEDGTVKLGGEAALYLEGSVYLRSAHTAP
jgi:PhzF family phenazine biosynthesis protein